MKKSFIEILANIPVRYLVFLGLFLQIFNCPALLQKLVTVPYLSY